MRSDGFGLNGSRPAIDGVLPAESVTPDTAQTVAETLADAAARGQAVAPVGGGTALGLGNRPERIDLLLSTERLSGILDYEPTDLVLSVGAGAKLADVQAVLGEHGQRLPIDPPGGAGATIGGLIATARWGPLRHGHGTLRDLLIGISVAHPSGTVTRAGGMVVKNVSGYDMPRLYHGSLGTLGVITSANFKVLPRPRAEATVVAEYEDGAEPFADAAILRDSGAPLAALEIFRSDGAWAIAARIEGREPTVKSLANRVAGELRAGTRSLPGDESVAWWENYVARGDVPPASRDVLIRCAVRPRDAETLAAGILAALEQIGVSVTHLAVTPGIGVVAARLDLGENGSAERLGEVQAVLVGLAETATIVAAPPDWKSGIDVWGRLPDGFEVMRSLREQFDPTRTLNPGRFAGFL